MKLTDENAMEYWNFQNYVLKNGFHYTRVYKKPYPYANNRSIIAHAFLHKNNLMNDFNKWRNDVDCDIYVLPELMYRDAIEQRKRKRNAANEHVQIVIYLIVHDLCDEFKSWLVITKLAGIERNFYAPRPIEYTDARFKRFKTLLWHLSEDDEEFLPCKKPR